MRWVRRLGLVPLYMVVVPCAATTSNPEVTIPLQEAIDEVEHVADRFRGLTDTEEVAAVEKAVNTLVEKCMSGRGWDLRYAQVDSDFFDAELLMTRTEMWTFSDLAGATSNGYGIEGFLDRRRVVYESPEVERANVDDLVFSDETEKQRFFADLFGEAASAARPETGNSSDDGCLGHARVQIYGDLKALEEFEAFRGVAGSEIWDAVMEDQLVTTALSEWRTCMTEAIGVEVADPEDAVNETMKGYDQNRQDGSLVSEQTMAVADVRCKRQSALLRTFVATFLKAARDRTSAYSDTLADYDSFLDDAVARARNQSD